MCSSGGDVCKVWRQVLNQLREQALRRKGRHAQFRSGRLRSMRQEQLFPCTIVKGSAWDIRRASKSIRNKAQREHLQRQSRVTTGRRSL